MLPPFLFFSLGLISSVLTASASEFLPNRQINSGVPWYDTAGKLINCHGAGIIEVDGVYFMVGEKRTNNAIKISGDLETLFIGCALYSSNDLVNWEDKGTPILPIEDTEISGRNIVERPKIIYNQKSKEFIVYMHNWKGDGNVCFATSPAITGPYKYQGSLKSDQGNPVKGGDIGVFVDTDATAYLLETNGIMFQLASDYKSVRSTDLPRPITMGHTESPTLFKVNKTYFYLCSTMNWWGSDDNYYATATSMKGPWTTRGLFAPRGSHTWNSQTTCVLPVVGSKSTTCIYMGDRWCDGSWITGTDVWQPLEIDGTKLFIPSYIPSWRVDIGTGEWREAIDGGDPLNASERRLENNQITYFGNWSHPHLDDDAYSDRANDSATIPFRGSQIKLYGAVDSQHGILGVTLSDGNGAVLLPETTITQYSNTGRQENYLNYVSPVLRQGSYHLTIRITGRKDYYSLGYYGSIDGIAIK